MPANADIHDLLFVAAKEVVDTGMRRDDAVGRRCRRALAELAHVHREVRAQHGADERDVDQH
jgi:hypothetical protein